MSEMYKIAARLIGMSFLILIADMLFPDKGVYRGVKTILYLLETLLLLEPLTKLIL